MAATITATYVDDVARVHITLSNMLPGLTYLVERSLTGATWTPVRGGTVRATDPTFEFDDYEYVPNVANQYRVVSPAAGDAWDRDTTNEWGTATTGELWDVDPPTAFSVQNPAGVMQIADPPNGALAVFPYEATDFEYTGSFRFTENITQTTRVDVDFRRNLALLNEGYGVELSVNPQNPQLRATIYQQVADTTRTAISPTVNVDTFLPGTYANWRIRAVGPKIQTKIWTSLSPMDEEPEGFTLAANDDTYTTGVFLFFGVLFADGTQTLEYRSLNIYDIPPTTNTTTVTPVQTGFWFKSLAQPVLNQQLDCANWESRSYDGRAGIFDVKGAIDRVAVLNVGSSDEMDVVITTRGEQSARMLRLLWQIGAPIYIQSPDEGISGSEPPCNTPGQSQDGYTGWLTGFYAPGQLTETHVLPGWEIAQWEAELTRVRPTQANGTTGGTIAPTMMTWRTLWAIIGEGGTWEDVWARWNSWEELWLHQPSVDNVLDGVATF